MIAHALTWSGWVFGFVVLALGGGHRDEVDGERPRQRGGLTLLDLLPERSAIAEMLSDYAVMREQARTCTPT